MKQMNEKLQMLRKTIPEEIAKSIVDVQPIPSDIIDNLYKASASREWLIENGYEPVSGMKLLWRKKND